MGQIELYHNIFLISSVLAGLFLAVSIVMFFAFDMRRMFGKNTGKSKGKPMKQLKRFQGMEAQKKSNTFSLPQTQMRCDNITTKLKEKEVAEETSDIYVNQEKAAGFVVLSETMEVHSDKLIDGLLRNDNC